MKNEDCSSVCYLLKIGIWSLGWHLHSQLYHHCGFLAVFLLVCCLCRYLQKHKAFLDAVCTFLSCFFLLWNKNKSNVHIPASEKLHRCFAPPFFISNFTSAKISLLSWKWTGRQKRVCSMFVKTHSVYFGVASFKLTYLSLVATTLLWVPASLKQLQPDYLSGLSCAARCTSPADHTSTTFVFFLSTRHADN